jgi:hypothetical protein
MSGVHNPHPAMDLLLLDGDGFGRTESNWKNIEIEENLIKLKKWRNGETIPIPPWIYFFWMGMVSVEQNQIGKT